MVIPLHGVAGSTRRDPDTTAKSYNYCDATANRHGHAVVSNDIAFSRSAVTHRRSSAVMTATMNPRFVRPAPSALGPAHTPRTAGREAGVAHPSDTETPCRAQNTTREPHTTASRNRPPLRRTHCDGAGGPSQGATSQLLKGQGFEIEESVLREYFEETQIELLCDKEKKEKRTWEPGKPGRPPNWYKYGLG